MALHMTPDHPSIASWVSCFEGLPHQVSSIIFCPGPCMHQHLQHNISTSDFNANMTAMENFQKALSYHGQIDAQISTNSCQIGPNDPQEHTEKLQAPCYYNFSEKIWSPGMRWDNFSSHTITLFGNDAFIQLSKLAKSGSWHCHLRWQCTRLCVTYLMQEMYQWKEDELSLLICHT